MMIRGLYRDMFLETMLPALDAKVKNGYREKPSMLRKLFAMEGSTKGIEQFSEVSGLGYALEIPEGEDVRFDTPVQGFDKTFKHKRFGRAYKYSQDLVEDDKWGLIRQMATELGWTIRQTRELQAASVFNNAFTAGDYAGPDGVALCANNHPQYYAGTAQSNILAAAADLAVESLELALTDWELTERENGMLIQLPTPRILVAAANRWNIHEILKSTMRSDTANNATNAFKYGEMGPVSDILVWPLLTDPDAWFLVAPPEWTGLKWFDRRAPYTRGGFDDESEAGWTAMRYKSSWGFKNYVGVYGTPGMP
jgi:hypothetical protein